MGNSLPPSAAIDLVGSYARRQGDDVKIVLWDPQFSTRTSVLVLEKGRGSARGQVELIDDDSGRRLVGHVPRRSVKRRAAAKAGRAVDLALRVLPPDRVTKVRPTVRKTARKVLS